MTNVRDARSIEDLRAYSEALSVKIAELKAERREIQQEIDRRQPDKPQTQVVSAPFIEPPPPPQWRPDTWVGGRQRRR